MNCCLGVFLGSLYYLRQIIKIIRHGMGKLNGVIFNCEVVFKGESLVVFFGVILKGNIIVLVKYIETSSSPIFFSFIAFERSDARFHPLIVKGVRFVLNKLEVTRLTMLKLATKLFLLFLTLKLYHWVHPPVLASFCRSRS